MPRQARVICYTSITFSYLSRARVLAWSLKRFHPDWHFVVVITDREPEGFDFDVANENFDEVIWGQDLDIPNIESWLFMHNIVEVCTAVKGPVLDQLVKREYADKVFYIDPDIAVFNPLDSLVGLLDEYEILLTPHQLTPEPASAKRAILDNEIGSLKFGIYNLGFVGVRAGGEGLRFAKWWRDRLLEYCYDDVPNGLFTDQRWCDHVPSFFNNVYIVKDPGCNVASWNISQRNVKVSNDGDILVNGSKLKFYHVTKYGPVGRAMTERYAEENTEIYEIWAWYGRKLSEFTSPEITKGWWFYGLYEDGRSIEDSHRELYKSRMDLRQNFTNPFSSEGSFTIPLLVANDG